MGNRFGRSVAEPFTASKVCGVRAGWFINCLGVVAWNPNLYTVPYVMHSPPCCQPRQPRLRGCLQFPLAGIALR